MLEGAALERRQKRVDVRDQEIGGAHELHIETGVEHVRGRHALMHEARLRPHDLGQVGEEGFHVRRPQLARVSPATFDSTEPKELADPELVAFDGDVGQIGGRLGLRRDEQRHHGDHRKEHGAEERSDQEPLGADALEVIVLGQGRDGDGDEEGRQRRDQAEDEGQQGLDQRAAHGRVLQAAPVSLPLPQEVGERHVPLGKLIQPGGNRLPDRVEVE